MADEEDPLVKALPPATDYLTYLTLLEYQLTPARLPTLHRLLQDETLTTNIGWDLVQLLLPMLPQSQECLQDVARLGNPREVILRVSDALMKLEPQEEEEEEEEESQDAKTLEEKVGDIDINKESADGKRPVPRHVLQFNCLVAMLSVLHARIKTKYPSRFIATSLQAALEAYTSMPTNETTTAFLEFLRDLSPTKRPALPPRGSSQSSVVRVSEASAPDPEAETQSTSSNDQVLVRKLLQFGLIEVLKSYMLSVASPTESGMSLALRLQEKLRPEEARTTTGLSKTHIHAATEHLKERDMIIGKITALSRDFGLNDGELLRIVSAPAEKQPPPLDFEELPKSPEGIPLERHGSLLLLAARFSTTVLFSGQENVRIPIYPDLAVIFSNFIDAHSGAALEQPQALQDALLALTVISIREQIEEPVDDRQYEDFVLALTACSSRQSYNSLRRIPSTVVRSHPSQIARFKLIRKVLESEDLLYARESAIGWLKDEILATQVEAEKDTATVSTNIFVDPHYFSVLFPLLFNSTELSSLDPSSSSIVVSWVRFSQLLATPIHAALSLYYILLSSPQLCKQLELGKTLRSFQTKFLAPLKSLCRTFEEDLTENGGAGQIEAAVGEDTCRMGMARSVGLLYHVIEQIEERVAEVFDHDHDDEGVVKGEEQTAEDMAKVAEIRSKTAPAPAS
ncbi:hypothetical protein VTN77DRAFT_5258 [Rasamsonia byssochlamydoides]|uniref:uncharacterized protein n=1 Tax=Rasamsonia byssochlamydoides TaxID=89139 RepID=UPI0037448A4A